MSTERGERVRGRKAEGRERLAPREKKRNVGTI